MAEEKKVTSYEEFIAEYERRRKTAFVKTTSGQTFEIKLMSPGDFVMVMNTLMVQKLMPELVDGPDTLTESHEQKVMDLMKNDEFLNSIKGVVCGAVISVNLANKPQEQCDGAKKELSIDILDTTTLLELNMAIRKASVPEEDSDQVRLFRVESAEADAGDGASASNSENVRDPAIGNPVSGNGES